MEHFKRTNMTNGARLALITIITAGVITASVIFFKRLSKSKTQEALPSGENVSPEAQKIITEAQKWVGVKEIQDNAGWENKNFEKLMKERGGWWKGAAYCACFVKMVLVSVSSGNAQAFFKSKLNAAAKNTWNVLQKSDYSEKIDKPEAGAILCYEHHNEICESTYGKKNTVISANSPLGNDKKVQGVTRRTRPAGEGLDDDPFLGYIRIKKLS